MTRYRFLPVLAVAMAALTGTGGPAAADSGHIYRIPPGESARIERHGVCKVVSVVASANSAVMIPTRVAGEWSEGDSAFLAEPRRTTTVTDCAPAGDCTEMGETCADGSINMSYSLDRIGQSFVTDETYEIRTAWGDTGFYGATSVHETEDNTTRANGAPTSYCENLSAHGHDDWYLPSVLDLQRLKLEVVPTEKQYWSSTEAGVPNRGQAYYLDASRLPVSPYQRESKSATKTVRCFRTGEFEVAEGEPDPCDDDPAPGMMCKDGTVYGGDVQGDIYIASHEHDVTWTGPVTYDFPEWEDNVNGQKNMPYMLNGPDPFYPAAVCDQLTAHGHDDWYLPSGEEMLDMMYTYFDDSAYFYIRGLGALDPLGHYWTSSNMVGWPPPYRATAFDTFHGDIIPSEGIKVRCMRRNTSVPEYP